MTSPSLAWLSCPRPRWCLAAALLHQLSLGSAVAGEVDVLRAEARCSPDSICRFSVTLRHGDTGWEHYADRFEVQSLDGDMLGFRILRHPHVREQPFTRVLEGVTISRSIERVRIRARDSVHGYGGAELTIQLSRATPP